MSYFLVQEAVDNALWDMVKECTQYPDGNITWGQTDKIRPEEPYITLRMINLERAAKGRHLGYDEDTCEEITGADYIVKYEVAAFREDRSNEISPMATCWNISQALVQNQYRSILDEAEVGFSDSTNVINISVQIDGASWEQRASFVVTFICAVSDKATVATDVIESVEVEQNLLDSAEELVSKEIYTIPEP